MLTVKMDQMIRCVRNPYVRLPGYIGQIARHISACWERGDEDQAGGSSAKKPGEFIVAFAIHLPVACNGLY